MAIEKLIEQLRKSTDFEDYPIVASFAAIIEKKYLREAADVLSTLQAENEKLRKELEWKDMVIELAQRKEREAKAELEQVKRERDAAVECINTVYSYILIKSKTDAVRTIEKWLRGQKED